MDFEALPVVVLVAGMVLLYGAIKNKNPIGVIQAALTGKDLSTVAPLMGAANTAGPGAIPGTALPGTPGADGDARTDPPSFDPNRDSILPNYGGSTSPRIPPVSYQVPFNPGNGVV